MVAGKMGVGLSHQRGVSGLRRRLARAVLLAFVFINDNLFNGPRSDFSVTFRMKCLVGAKFAVLPFLVCAATDNLTTAQ